MTGTSDRVVEALARLNHHVHHAKTANLGAPMTIALSRQAGAGGAEIAQVAGARLGWPVYDHELLDRIAEEKGLNPHLLESLDERYLSWIEETARSFWGPRGHEVATYLSGLRRQLAALGHSGRCIIVGHGAPHLLPRETTLCIRVIAPRELRIAQVQRNKNLSAEEAERWIDQTERQRLRFLERHFNARPDDPFAFDLVLNRGNLSVEQCAELIVQALRLREAHAPVARC
jgi:cytidylate kinase